MSNPSKKAKFSSVVGGLAIASVFALLYPRKSLRMAGPALWAMTHKSLHEAIRVARDEQGEAAVERLRELSKQTNFKKPDAHGSTVLMYAALSHNAGAKIDFLLPLSDPLAKNSEGTTALMAATHLIGTEGIERLIPVSDVNARNKAGETALILAVCADAHESIPLLLPVSDLSVTGSNGMSLASLIAKKCQWPSLEQALAAGAGAGGPDLNGDTALIHASRRGYKEMIGMLLPLSDPNHQNDQGETALMLLARQMDTHGRNRESMELLAKASDAFVLDNQGRLAFDHAVENENWTALDILAFSAPIEKLAAAVKKAELDIETPAFKLKAGSVAPPSLGRAKALLEAAAIREAMPALAESDASGRAHASEGVVVSRKAKAGRL